MFAKLSPADGLNLRIEVTVVLSGRLPLSSLSSLRPVSGFECETGLKLEEGGDFYLARRGSDKCG